MLSPADHGYSLYTDSDFDTTNGWVTNVITLNADLDHYNRHSWDVGVTPIVIDLNGDGVQTVSRENAGGEFDLLGNGQTIKTGWASSEDGMLAIDNNGDGQISDINELFGGLSQGDGFAKLSEFDSNGDGVVNAEDDRFAELKIWQDSNGNHQTDEGELKTLVEAGVAELSVDYVEIPEMDANGNLHLERSSATLADGSVVDMTDVYFNVSATDAKEAGVELPTMGELLSVDVSLDGVLNQGMQLHQPLPEYAESAGLDSSSDALSQLAGLYDQMAYQI